MNLRNEILKEHSKAQTNKIVKYVGNDKTKFAELIKLFLGNEYRVTQRSAWAVSYVVEKYPFIIKPYFKKIILNLKNKSLHDAVKRNTLRLLQFVEVPENLQGELTEICFGFLLTKDEPIAVKVFAMTVLGNISKQHPELKNELIAIIESQFFYSSSGYKARAKKVLADLEKI